MNIAIFNINKLLLIYFTFCIEQSFSLDTISADINNTSVNNMSTIGTNVTDSDKNDKDDGNKDNENKDDTEEDEDEDENSKSDSKDADDKDDDVDDGDDKENDEDNENTDSDDEGNEDNGNDEDDEDEDEDEDDEDEDDEDEATDEYNEEIDDPFEKFNRRVFEFNDKLNKDILTPMMSSKHSFIPEKIKTGVKNAASNFFELPRAFNHLLQFNGEKLGITITRFFINTIVGFFGVADVATHLDLKKCNTNFGDTLKKWGVKPGAYVVLPILGPKSMRGVSSLMWHVAIDNTSFLPYFKMKQGTKIGVFYSAYAVDLLNSRSAIGQLMEHIDATAKDKYKAYRSIIMSMEN